MCETGLLLICVLWLLLNTTTCVHVSPSEQNGRAFLILLFVWLFLTHTMFILPSLISDVSVSPPNAEQAPDFPWADQNPAVITLHMLSHDARLLIKAYNEKTLVKGFSWAVHHNSSHMLRCYSSPGSSVGDITCVWAMQIFLSFCRPLDLRLWYPLSRKMFETFWFFDLEALRVDYKRLLMGLSSPFVSHVVQYALIYYCTIYSAFNLKG